jgi:7-cyano-7-deazaguanine synthase
VSGGGVVVLNSGGMDSAVALALAVADRGADRVVSLHVGYGQRAHCAEARAARELSLHLGCAFDFAVVTMPQGISVPLLEGGGSLPDVAEAALGVAEPGGVERAVRALSATVLPYRNLTLASIAASLASSTQLGEAWVGVTADDHAPDCGASFLRALSGLLAIGAFPGVRLGAPLSTMSKAAVVAEGERLRVPWALTWTCYDGAPAPCRRCAACVKRERGFSAAGVADPLA